MNLSLLKKVVLSTILFIFLFTTACAPTAPAPMPVVDSNTLVDEAMDAAVAATLKLEGVTLVADMLEFYENDPTVNACIQTLSGYTGMDPETITAKCTEMYLKPMITKTTAGDLATRMGVGEFYLVQMGSTALGRSIASGSWFTPVLIAFGFATGASTAMQYIVSSDTYHAKAMTWDYQVIAPETELSVVSFSAATTNTIALDSTIPAITSWELTDLQLVALETQALSIQASAACDYTGSGSQTVKGPRGSEFFFTWFSLPGYCYMSMFHQLRWFDGTTWLSKIIEVKHEEPRSCKPMDFVTIFRLLAEAIRDYVKKSGWDSKMYNSYVWHVIDDLLHFCKKHLVMIAEAMGVIP